MTTKAITVTFSEDEEGLIDINVQSDFDSEDDTFRALHKVIQMKIQQDGQDV